MIGFKVHRGYYLRAASIEQNSILLEATIQEQPLRVVGHLAVHGQAALLGGAYASKACSSKLMAPTVIFDLPQVVKRESFCQLKLNPTVEPYTHAGC